jgi:hypothetical protein
LATTNRYTRLFLNNDAAVDVKRKKKRRKRHANVGANALARRNRRTIHEYDISRM